MCFCLFVFLFFFVFYFFVFSSLKIASTRRISLFNHFAASFITVAVTSWFNPLSIIFVPDDPAFLFGVFLWASRSGVVNVPFTCFSVFILVSQFYPFQSVGFSTRCSHANSRIICPMAFKLVGFANPPQPFFPFPQLLESEALFEY